MNVVHRRLFWKVYLTLLASLVAVAVLIGCIWWLLDHGLSERWSQLRSFAAHVATERNAPPEILDEEAAVIAEEIGADISIYAPDGILIARNGEPIQLSTSMAGRPWGGAHRIIRIDLPDGRVVLARPLLPPPPPGLHILMVVLVVAGGVGLAAFPVTSRLTRRLEALRAGVKRWGAGVLSARVDDSGADEVASVARTFNAAAERIEHLLNSQKALLANASHELRSPLARLRIAIELWLERPTEATHAEIVRDLAEVDELVEEILLASRLDHAGASPAQRENVDLLGLAAEEAARADAVLSGSPVEVCGEARLLRRMIRNLLENAVKHGAPPVEIDVSRQGETARIVVSDHGEGIPPAERERVFEPFYRPGGRSEARGGWGLGLSLVRQIAMRHGGRIACEEATGSGSRFVVELASVSEAERAGPERANEYRGISAPPVLKGEGGRGTAG